MKIGDIINSARAWFFRTPERALDQAYQCALKIKAIEDEHFGGGAISSEYGEYGKSAIAYFRADTNQYIKTAKFRLKEFKASNSFMRLARSRAGGRTKADLDQDNDFEFRELPSIIIEKLDFIDAVISKYEIEKVKKKSSVALVKNESGKNRQEIAANREVNENGERRVISTEGKLSQIRVSSNLNQEETDISTISDKTGIVPRSILRTLNRIRQDIDPQSDEAEQQVIQNYRQSRNKTSISIRFLLILIIVPLLTHQITKTFIIAPLVENYIIQEQQVLFVNQDLEENALSELRTYEENLRFKGLIGLTPELSPAEIETAVRERASEIALQYRSTGADGIENIFADLFSLVGFIGVIYFSKREIAVLKSFMDEILYGLSDSAKAFLIILFTDVFVGYHSPHGWEVVLEGIARHFALPGSHQFDFLFIATFPVILDTVLKYWIFRYLNRISPSAVATYRNMNE